MELENKVKGEYDKNAGLITKIWGGCLWVGLHSITFGYPQNPTDDDKKNYKTFFTSLQYTLPCKFCRESYSKFISSGEVELTDDRLKSRETLTRWLYDLHNKVNQKLGVDYKVSFEDVVKRYESYRAKCIPDDKGCNMPLDLKAHAFENAIIKDCPVVDYLLALKFKDYGLKRGVQEFNSLDTYYEYYQNKIHNIKCDKWVERNKECRQIIQDIRINSKKALEEDGEYRGLPTIDELKLIAKLTTTLSIDKLEKVSNKLKKSENKVLQSGGMRHIKKYKLISL